MRTEHLARALETPHPLQDTGEPKQLLASIINTAGIDLELARIDDPDIDEKRLAAADFVADQVRKALWYPVKEAGRNDFDQLRVSDPPRLEDLETGRQAADCIGFTYVTSYFLEKQGIDHWVAFANNHAGIIVDSDKDREMFFIDPLSPELDQNLFPAVRGVSKEQIADDVLGFDRTAIMLDSDRLITGSRLLKTNPYGASPWLSAKPIDEQQGVRVGIEDSPKIVMSLFPPQVGRLVLEGWNKLQHSVLAKEFYDAADALHEIGSFYPNMDARNPHKELKWVVRNLALRGHYDEASIAVEDYFETFGFIKDSRFDEARGDCFKIIALVSRSLYFARLAIEAYEDALDVSTVNIDTVTSKIDKLATRAGLNEA